MPKQSLNKSITAKKLNRRTMTPLPEQEVTIPFGAIIEKVEITGDSATFEYLTEPYGCKRDMLQGGIAASKDAPSGGSQAMGHSVAAATAALQFEALDSTIRVSRAKVPGGWLLATPEGGIGFYPDAKHEWDGQSL